MTAIRPPADSRSVSARMLSSMTGQLAVDLDADGLKRAARRMSLASVFRGNGARSKLRQLKRAANRFLLARPADAVGDPAGKALLAVQRKDTRQLRRRIAG